MRRRIWDDSLFLSRDYPVSNIPSRESHKNEQNARRK